MVVLVVLARVYCRHYVFPSLSSSGSSFMFFFERAVF